MSALVELNKEIQYCQDCDLGKHRTRAVPGEGPENPSILFIGEAPGWHEDQQGRPFVGPAGKYLEELLASINLKREQVFIANVIKCRPPSNRDPLPGEIQACSKWLTKQIELLRPKMIVTLGRYSMAKYFSNQSIGQIHGKAKRQDDVTLFAMYHPAAALHQASLRKTIEADMLKIPALLDGLKEAEEAKPPAETPPPQQLSMF